MAVTKILATALSLMVMASVISGCSGPPTTPGTTSKPAAKSTLSSTPSPAATPSAILKSTTTPTPTPYMAPTPLPLQAPGWEAITIRTLHLTVEQSYSGVEGPFSRPIAETAHRLLGLAGVQTAAEGVQSDATLTVTVAGEARGANYAPGGFRYSGAEIRGRLILAVPGRAPLTLFVEGIVSPRTIISLGGYGSPRDAPFDNAWSLALLDGFGKLWGIEFLARALRDKDTYVQSAASTALVKIGPPAVRPLAQALNEDTDISVRRVAASALGEIEPKTSEAVQALAKALRDDKDSTVRSAAASALGESGPKASEAVQALAKALSDDKDSTVRSATAYALGRSKAVEAVPALTQALISDKDSNVRRATANAIGEIGPKAESTVPSLIQALGNDLFDYVRQAAADALGRIGPEAKKAIPALIQALGDDKTKSSAVSALKAITGQNFGEDAERWQQWFQTQKPTP